MQALVESGENVKYNVVVGISGGAVNAGAFAKYNVGDEADVTQFMVKMWTDLKHQNMWQRYNSVFMPDLRVVPAMFDTTPQHAFLRTIFDADQLASTTRRSYVAVTNLETYQVKLVSSRDSTFLDAVVASSAFPLIYPPVMLNDTYYIDGGYNFTTPIHDLVDLCRTTTLEDTGSLPTAIHIDIMIPNGNFESELDQTHITGQLSFFDVAYKVGVKLGASFFTNDYDFLGDPALNITTRVFKPDAPLTGLYLSFTHSKEYIKKGYFDALEVLEADE